MKMRHASSIDEYISRFPGPTQSLLQQLRRAIRSAAPEAREAMKYGIPTFVLNGNLVHFGGYVHHVSFYPTSTPIRVFRQELSAYELSKGTVRFPLDQPLPIVLIRKIVQFRVAQSNPFFLLAAPAQRALARAGITSIKQLSKRTERQVAELHGMGPQGIRKLRTLLRANGAWFKRDSRQSLGKVVRGKV
jgi:uncharacterized protein YdhG (YjbR/CyaY superfamily)